MFHARLKLIAVLILAGMVLIVARLGWMQLVMANHYRREGHERRIRRLFPPAPRGSILARDGTILASDRPVLSLGVVLRELDGVSPPAGRTSRMGVMIEWDDFKPMSPEEHRQWLRAVAAIAGDSVEGVEARIDQVRDRVEEDIEVNTRRILSGKDKGIEELNNLARLEERMLRWRLTRSPRTLYEDVPFEVVARAEAASADLRVIAVMESLKRRYREKPLAPHVVGYTNDITIHEYDLYRLDYLGDEAKRVFYHDTMGRTGIEERFNFELRGSRGRREEVINVYGQTQKVLSETIPLPGSNITLTIDPAVQEAAEKALAKVFGSTDCPGAAVCIDVFTGDVLAMASYPAYDPNTLKAEFAALLDTDGFGRYRPLLNRAIMGRYPLGSVFKTVTAVAALESGAIKPQTTFECKGFYLRGRNSRSWCHKRTGHGLMDLTEGIKKSCNVYFYNAGVAAGGTALVEWAVRFGFGRSTGLDLPGEAAGQIPITRSKGDVVNLSVGQGALLVTPLQVARMMAAVANGGMLVEAHLERGAGGGIGRSVGMRESTLRVLRNAFYKVVNERGGTGYNNVRSNSVKIAGKTGTAQAPKGDHAWFAGFAPFDEPRIAFAVVVEHGGHGGPVAGPVGKAIAEAWARENPR